MGNSWLDKTVDMLKGKAFQLLALPMDTFT